MGSWTYVASMVWMTSSVLGRVLNVNAVSAWLGHSSPTVTLDTYLVLTPDTLGDVSVDRADGVKHGVVGSADGPVYCFARRAQGGRVVNGVIGAIDQGGWIERRRRLELAGRHVESRSWVTKATAGQSRILWPINSSFMRMSNSLVFRWSSAGPPGAR